MGREGVAVFVQHLLGVAVVGCHQRGSPELPDVIEQLADGGVHRLHGRDRRRDAARVADHVRVGVVDEDEVVVRFAEVAQQRAGEFLRAHIGLEVVGRNVW